MMLAKPVGDGVHVDGDGNALIGGRYRLVRQLGRGGMAEVWLATDQRLNGKQVAVKRLLGFSTAGPETEVDVERARREAYAASRLNHPNLVAVTDFVAEDGEPFIVMEYVEGSTLDELVQPPGLSEPRVARLIGQVAAALLEAHDAGIVHRDIKPTNIMVTRRDVAKLADFGIARTAGDVRLTRPGFLTGTIAYLAPEVLEGDDASPASDVWALGAVLFEAIEGRPAFEGKTTAALIAAIALREAPKSTRSENLGPIVDRMLLRDPSARAPIESIAEDLAALPTGRAADSASRTTLLAVPAPGRVGDWTGVPPTPPPPPPSGPRSGRPTPTPPPVSSGSASPSDYLTPWPPPSHPSHPSQPPLPALPPTRPARPRRTRWRWVAAVVAVIALGIGIPFAIASGGDSHGTTTGAGSRSAAPTGTTSSSPVAPVPAKFTVLAHEGGGENFAEETLPAFQQAASNGNAVEGDIRWTSDGVAVMSHDDTTGEQFACKGGPRSISHTTLAALQRDCHSLPESSLNGATYSIPTFAQTVDALKVTVGATLFAEVKTDESSAEIEQLLAILQDNRMTDRTVVTSFLPSELTKIRRYARNQDVSLRLMRFIGTKPNEAPADALQTEGLWAVAVNYQIATVDYLQDLHEAGFRTVLFTLNSPTQWAKAQSWGINYVITDKPVACTRWLGAH